MISQLLDELDITSALVVAPLRVCQAVWPEEVEKWNDFKHLRVKALFNPEVDMHCPADVYLINPEKLHKLFGQRGEGKGGRAVWRPGPWKNWVNRPEMLVLDESSRFKTTSAVRTQTIFRYLDDFSRRVALTGTPATNGLMDLHGQMLLIDGGEALDHRITYFQKKYFDAEVCGGAGRKYTRYDIKDGGEERIYDAIRERITVLRAEDYLKLPEFIYTDVPVVLPKRVMKQIEDLREFQAAEVNGTEVMEQGGAGAKTRQLISGMIYTDLPFETHRNVEHVHDAKIDALTDLLDELGRPAMVSYEFRHEREAILKKLRGIGRRPKRRVGVIGGGLPSGQALQAIKDWNAGLLDVLLVHPAAAGHGLNLQQGGNVVIWFTVTWDLELYIQLNGRLRRQGQAAANVFVYHLVGVGTLDRRVCRVLKRKDATQEALFDALKEDE